MTLRKIAVTDARLQRAMDAYMAEGVMWSWRIAGPYIYQLVRDESAFVGRYPPFSDMATPAKTVTVIPMLGSVKSDADAKKIFTDMRHRAAMMKALEAAS